jgi:DNA-binding MarR family transcriptional regulator
VVSILLQTGECGMTLLTRLRRLEQRRRATVKSRSAHGRHTYFQGVAEARFVLRKVFRLIEAQAKRAGIDPLGHQALIQIYGSVEGSLRVKEVAECLDIAPAFASSLVNTLIEKGYVTRRRDVKDQRVARVAATKEGISLLSRIDEEVRVHVDYFTRQLSQAQREDAISIFMFYLGGSFDPSASHSGMPRLSSRRTVKDIKARTRLVSKRPAAAPPAEPVSLASVRRGKSGGDE